MAGAPLPFAARSRRGAAANLVAMPEYPDVTVYCSSLQRLVVGQRLDKVELRNPFLLRTVAPPLSRFEGHLLQGVSREAKQIVLHFGEAGMLLIHLMIAGRLRWRARGQKVPPANLQALFHFSGGTLLFTEAGTKRRARLYALPPGQEGLAGFRRGGLEVMQAGLPEFAQRLRLRNHTLRRALTDQALFSGIGNAYSDEILFAARLSPMRQTQKLEEEEVERLYHATRATLAEWADKLAREVGDGFPERVTAFHPDMACHGRYGQPCRVCGTPIQRIRYADNETNYCPQCQNEGRLLADRSLSRLLKSDWPRTVEELELHKETRKS
jgi:formamidopyrimidine-DNA glycosylase